MEYVDLKFISDIKDDLDIVEIISNYISTYQQDEKYIAVCPFHDTSEKTLTIYPNTQTYYCSECKCHGDVLTFIRNYEHVSFEETMDIANRLVGFENLNNSNQKFNNNIMLSQNIPSQNKIINNVLNNFNNEKRFRAIDYTNNNPFYPS